MLKHLSAFDLSGIARAGGSFAMDGSQFTAFDISGIVRAMKVDAVIEIENCAVFSAFDLNGIARAAVGTVIFR